MATFTMSSATSQSPKKRVSFAHDDADLLMKPKPSKVAEYTETSPTLLDWIKTAEQLEAEVEASFAALKLSSNAWKPRRQRSSSIIIEAAVSEEEDMKRAIAELESIATLMVLQ